MAKKTLTHEKSTISQAPPGNVTASWRRRGASTSSTATSIPSAASPPSTRKAASPSRKARALIGAMHSNQNLRNRWVYLILGIGASTNPFLAKAKASGMLKLDGAEGVVDHVRASLALLASGDHYNVTLHDMHKPTHGITETFDHVEIERIVQGRSRALQAGESKSPPEAGSSANGATDTTPAKKSGTSRKTNKKKI